MTNTASALSGPWRLIRRSPVALLASLPPRNLKPNPRPIPNYPSLDALLMEAANDFSERMHVPSRRKVMWVEKGRGE